jgi:hypothetical protein
LRPNPTPFGVQERVSQALGQLHRKIAFVLRNLRGPGFEPIAPDLCSIVGVDELRTDNNAIAGTAQIALNQVAHI